MSDLTPKTYEVVLNSKDFLNSACNTFVYEPENVEEEKLGYLYIVGQVLGQDATRKRGLALLSFLAAQTSKSFFRKTDFEPKEALEKTLAETNRIFEKELKSGRFSWAKQLNMAVILLTPQIKRLCFAFRADSQGLLWRKGHLVDITNQINQDKSQGNDTKLFSTIASGSISLEDKIIFSSPALNKKIPAKDLNSAFDQTRYSGIQNIKEILALDENDNLALIILDLQNSAQKINQLKNKPLIAKNAHHLIHNQQKTTEISSIDKEKEITNKAGKKSKHLFFWSQRNIIVILTMSLLIVRKLIKYLPKLLIWSKKTIKRIRLPKKSYFSNIWFKLKNNTSIKIFKPLASSQKKIFSKIKEKILNKYFLTYLFLFLLIVIPFSIITFVLPNQPIHEKTLKNPHNQQLLLDISKKTLSSNAIGLYYRNDRLMMFDESSIYVYDLINKKGNFIFPKISNNDKIIYQTETKQYLIYLTSNNNIIKLDKDLLSMTIDRVSALEKEKIIGIDSFYKNIYVLTESGKIIKYSDLNFSSTSIWMNKTKDFGINYLSFAVDGSIYILDKSGLIQKYDAGKIDSEYLITTKGLAKKGDKIFTNINFKNIYFMSKSQDKIIIFNKKSQLPIKTIKNPNWTNLKSLYISPDETNMYILDGLKIYKTNI